MAAESKLKKTRTLIQGIKLKEAEEKIREVKAAKTSAKELISELTAGSKKILKDLEENAISLNIDLLVFKQKTTILSNMATEMRNNVERGIEKVLNARKDVMLLQLVAKVEVRKRLVLAEIKNLREEGTNKVSEAKIGIKNATKLLDKGKLQESKEQSDEADKNISEAKKAKNKIDTKVQGFEKDLIKIDGLAGCGKTPFFTSSVAFAAVAYVWTFS